MPNQETPTKDEAMRVDELIQNRAGVELPAVGSWAIAPGQRISAERRGRLRTKSIAVRTTGGALRVSPDPAVVTLEVGLVALDVDAEAALVIGFEGCLDSADRTGRWWFDGTVTIDGSAAPFRLALAYQGVHCRGAAPVAWLTIAEAYLAVERGRLPSRPPGRTRGLHLSGDLNAKRKAGGGAVTEVGRAASGSGLAMGRSVQQVAISDQLERHQILVPGGDDGRRIDALLQRQSGLRCAGQQIEEPWPVDDRHRL